MSTPERAGDHSPRWRDQPQLGTANRRYGREGPASARRGNDAGLGERIVERFVAGLGVLIFGLVAVFLFIVYWQLALFMALGAVGVGLVWWSRRSAEPAAVSEAGHAALPPIPPPPAPARSAAAPDERERTDAAYTAEVLSEAWRLTFQAMPQARCIDLSSREDDDDDDELEVVGETYRQDALAEVSSLTDGVVRRRDVVAVLVPEPTNRFDRNAVRVEVFGRLVGYIPREDAAEMSPVLLALQKSGLLIASEAEIVGGVGRSRDRLSFGIVLRIQDYSGWAHTLKGTVAARTAVTAP